ncbi:MAG TPA: sigma-70 family RNA polymerase sigma factor [Pseudonocardiaceae bacterium]|nr:sigma-70 family RNA polymerase sigma factor [Pseudonocardiaceae bacterium]
MTAADAAAEDQALVARAARGDQHAFDQLVRRHTPRLYRVALRIVRDPAEAEDVVQDAWIAAWRALARFRGDSAPSTWLYRVVTNTALAHLRRRRQTLPLAEDFEQTQADPRDDGPERSALRGEEVALVLRAVATLEPAQRIPLVLHELEGMSYEEVAEIVGSTVPALRSRLHRARVALLGKLRELQ